VGAGSGDINVANIDRDPQERDQITHKREKLGRAGRLSV
jgi:hypothetical protein